MQDMGDFDDGVEEAPICARRVIGTSGVRRSLTVFCERTAASVPLERCASCEHFIAYGEGGATLRCRMRDGTARSAEDPALVVGSTMSREVVCAEPAVLLAEVDAAVPHITRIVPIVSESDALLGLVRVHHAPRAATESLLPVEERMIGARDTVTETTSLEVALRRMAHARLRELVVLDCDGRVLGVLRDVDVMLRLARAAR